MKCTLDKTLIFDILLYPKDSTCKCLNFTSSNILILDMLLLYKYNSLRSSHFTFSNIFMSAILFSIKLNFCNLGNFTLAICLISDRSLLPKYNFCKSFKSNFVKYSKTSCPNFLLFKSNFFKLFSVKFNPNFLLNSSIVILSSKISSPISDVTDFLLDIIPFNSLISVLK